MATTASSPVPPSLTCSSTGTHAPVTASASGASSLAHSYHLRYHSHSGTLSRSLLGLLAESHCTDVQLSTGYPAETIRAHRLILSACSPYFKSLFNSLPSSASHPVIIIRDISYETLCAIIEFCYRGKFLSLSLPFLVLVHQSMAGFAFFCCV